MTILQNLRKALDCFLHGILLAVGNWVCMNTLTEYILKHFNLLDCQLFWQGIIAVFSGIIFFVGVGYEIESEEKKNDK